MIHLNINFRINHNQAHCDSNVCDLLFISMTSEIKSSIAGLMGAIFARLFVFVWVLESLESLEGFGLTRAAEPTIEPELENSQK